MRISDWSSDVCSSDLQAERTERHRRLGSEAPGGIEAAVKGHHGVAERTAQPIDHIADSDRHAAVAKAGEDVQQVPGGRLLLCRRPDPALRQHGAHAALPGPCGPQDATDRLDDDEEVRQQARSEVPTSELQYLMRIPYA